MSSSWKQVKKYERWVLIGIVVILLATFSVSSVTARGCSGPRRTQDDYGGSFEVAPGKRVSVSHEDFLEVYDRYAPLYEAGFGGPSILFGAEMREARHNRGLTGTWTHIVAVKAAEAAGYRVGDEELREGIQELVMRAQMTRPGMSPRDQGLRYSAQMYDEVIGYLGRFSRSSQYTRAQFETTVREILLKDKFLGDVVALQRHTLSREKAYEEWKATRQRVDLAFAAVPAAQFVAEAGLEETTRTAVGAQADAVRRLADAAKDVRRITTVVELAAKTNGAVPADVGELLGKDPGRSQVGVEMPKDPWGQPFAYAKVGDVGRVTSAGPDQKPGSADDVGLDVVETLDAAGTVRRTADAVMRWRETTKAWPTALADLMKAPAVEPGKPAVSAPLAEVPKDPWGKELVWDAATTTLRSSGPDGAAGTPDDVATELVGETLRVGWPARLAVFVLDGSKDAWGRALALRVTSGNPLAFEVSSAGADGADGTDDDVKTGNKDAIEAWYASVKFDYRLPPRRELEVLYAVPVLVPDAILTEAWKRFPDWRPSETEAFDVFRSGRMYRTQEGEGADAKPVDPKDPEKGYGADLLKSLREKGLVPKECVGWPVPDGACFGDRKDAPAAGTAGLPSPDADPLYKTYLERGWRHVVLRDQFLEKMLDAMLRECRTAAEAHDKWLAGGKAGPEPALVTFAQQLAKTKDLQPSADGASKGERFLQLYSTDGNPIAREDAEKLPYLEDYALWNILAPMKDGEYSDLPRPIRNDSVRTALHLVKQHASRDRTVDEVRDEVWPKYVESRAMERASKELDRVRADLAKPAEGAAKPDGEARASALVAAVEAAGKARGYTASFGRTGLFTGETARGQRDPVAPAGASDAERAAIAQRSFVRRNGWDAVRPTDQTGGKPVDAGSVGRFVLRDATRRGGETATGCAYVVLVAASEDAAPEEFHGREYGEWVRRKAYDETPEWFGGRASLRDREGYVLKTIFLLFDDWETVKNDYRVETNTDILMPKAAGGGARR